MPRVLIPDPKPTVHDMRGTMGYPINLIAMNDDWREILIEHYNRDANARPIAVRPGDQMIVGQDPTTVRTYWVIKNAQNPERPNAWAAHLRLVTPPMTVAGQTYY